MKAWLRDSYCWLIGHVFWHRAGEYTYECICMKGSATDLCFRFDVWKRRVCSLFRHPLTRRWWYALPPWDAERRRWVGGSWQSACLCGETGAVPGNRGRMLIGEGQPR